MIERDRGPLLTALFWCAAIGWIGVLFFFSGQSGAQSGALSLRVAQFILRALPFLSCPLEVFHPVLRKLAHFGIFAVEGFLLGMAAMRSLRRGAAGGALALLACGAMAALNEYHQSFVAGRCSAPADALIDTGGALAGVLMAWLIYALTQRRRNVII